LNRYFYFFKSEVILEKRGGKREREREREEREKREREENNDNNIFNIRG